MCVPMKKKTRRNHNDNYVIFYEFNDPSIDELSQETDEQLLNATKTD